MAIRNDDPTLPFRVWEEVTVTFNSVANGDTIVPHSLAPIDVEAVNYIPLRKSAAADVYHDVSVTRKPWQRNYIVLRSPTAGVVMTLLLYVSPQ